MEITDVTGKPVSRRDVEEAEQVVRKFMVNGIMKLPPELAVQIPNILRCLSELKATK